MPQQIALLRAWLSLLLRFSYQTAEEHHLVDGLQLLQVARIQQKVTMELPGIHSSLG